MTDDVVLAARAAQELQPAVQQFAAAIGRTGPVSELVDWLTDLIHYRRAPHKATLLMEAAEKIAATGLPTRAVEDRLLRAVMEDGALEDDRSMQTRWANLLANAAIADRMLPHVAFPEILKQLTPTEASMLEAMYLELGRAVEGASNRHPLEGFPIAFFNEALGVQPFDYATASANLVRLELGIRTGANLPPYVTHLATHAVLSKPIQLTQFGAAFVQACRPPDAEPLATSMMGIFTPDMSTPSTPE